MNSVSWNTIALKAILAQPKCRSLQLIAPRGYHSEPLDTGTRG